MIENALQKFLRQRIDKHCIPECEKLEEVAFALSHPTSHASIRSIALQHLSECELCREAVVLLAAESSEVIVPQKKISFWGFRPSMVLATSFALLLLVIGIVKKEPTDLLVKGKEDDLSAFLLRDEKIIPLTPNMQIFTADKINFFYSTQDNGYLKIIALDATGKISTLFADEIKPAQHAALPDGALVKEGHGCEWIIAIFSDTSFDFDTVDLAKKAEQSDSSCELKFALESARHLQIFPLRR